MMDSNMKPHWMTNEITATWIHDDPKGPWNPDDAGWYRIMVWFDDSPDTIDFRAAREFLSLPKNWVFA